MAAIVFPVNPSTGDVFTYGFRSWVWSTVAWQSTYTYAYAIDGGTAEEGQTIVRISLDGGNA